MPLAPRDSLLQMVKESREAILEDWRRHASACFGDGGGAATALLDHLVAQLADPGAESHDALDRFVLTCLDAGRDLSTTLHDLSAMRESVTSLLLSRAPPAEAVFWLQELHRALDGWVARASERYQHVRLRVLSCLDQLVASAGKAEDTDQLLQQLLKICAAEIPSLDVGSILLIDGGSVRARASCGFEVAAEQTLRLDSQSGLAGLLLSGTEPIHLVGDQILEVAVTPALRSAQLTALYGIRIDNGGGPLGIAFMGSRTAPGFSPDEQVLFGMLAHKTSTLLQQALLRTQLEKAHGLVQAFMDYSPAVVFLKDLQHRYLLANRQMQELIAESQPGGPPPPVVGQTTRELYPEEIAAAVDRDDDRALASGKAVESEQLIRRGRDQRVFLVTKFPVRNAQGVTVGLGGIASEVTARKRKELYQAFLATMGSVLLRETDLRQLCTRLADLVVAQLGDLCVLEAVDGEGVLRRFAVSGRDPGLVAALRRDPDRLRPHLLSEVERTGETQLLEELPPDWASRIAQDEEEARAWTRARPQSLVLLPLVARGHQVGALAVATLEGVRRFRPYDRSFFEELAARAALTLDNALLYGAASRAVADRDEVAGIVAHDLRGPLNVIVSAMQLLLKDHPQEASVGKVRVALRSANRMKRLIDDLLDMTRLEGGKLVVRREVLSLAAVVREVGEAQLPAFAKEGRSLTLELGEGDLWVRGDADRLVQVLENLLSNALKFTPPGGSITLATRQELGCALVSVSDTGVGIPRENLRHVFNRFWQASRTDRRGAGLGLAIAEGLVLAHEGRIWAESTPGAGTTIRFLLPLHPGDQPAAEDPRH